MNVLVEGVKKIRGHVKRHGTKWLGFVQVTFAALAIPGVFPEAWYPKVLALSGVLTAWRGFVNSANAQK